MKQLLCILAFAIIGKLPAQSDYSTIVTEINKLFVTSGKPETVTRYNDQTKTLIINNIAIPVTGDVIIRYSSSKEHQHKSHYAELYFQKGLAVTSTTDAQFKRAFYAISLPDRQSVHKFIKLYNELYNLSLS